MKVICLVLILIPLSIFGQRQFYGEYSISGLFEDMSTERLFLYDDHYFIYFKFFDSSGFISSYGKFEKSKRHVFLNYSNVFIDTTSFSKYYAGSDIIKLPSFFCIQKNRKWIIGERGSKLVKMPNTNQPRGVTWLGRTYYHIKPNDREYRFFLKRRTQLIKNQFIDFQLSDCQISNKKYFYLGREALIEK